MKNIFLMAIVTLFVTACVSPWNDQENAGLTDMHIYWEYDDSTQTIYPVEIRVTDGKEFGSVNLAFEMSDGTIFNFNGVDVRAFRGQELRAEVEKAIAEVYGDVAPAVVDTIMDAFTGGASSVVEGMSDNDGQ